MEYFYGFKLHIVVSFWHLPYSLWQYRWSRTSDVVKQRPHRQTICREGLCFKGSHRLLERTLNW